MVSLGAPVIQSRRLSQFRVMNKAHGIMIKRQKYQMSSYSSTNALDERTLFSGHAMTNLTLNAGSKDGGDLIDVLKLTA